MYMAPLLFLGQNEARFSLQKQHVERLKLVPHLILCNSLYLKLKIKTIHKAKQKVVVSYREVVSYRSFQTNLLAVFENHPIYLSISSVRSCAFPQKLLRQGYQIYIQESRFLVLALVQDLCSCIVIFLGLHSILHMLLSLLPDQCFITFISSLF